MVSIPSLALITILMGLIIAGAELIRKRGNPDTTGQRHFLFFIWTSLGFLTLLAFYWVFPNPKYGFLIFFAPPTPALIAMVLLSAREWQNLSGRQRKAILSVIFLLTGTLVISFVFGGPRENLHQVETILQGMLFLSVPLLLFVTWKWGNQYPFLFGTITILYLALFNILEMGSFSVPFASSPISLGYTTGVALAYLMIPGFAITTTAVLFYRSLKTRFESDETKQVSVSRNSLITQWVLIVLLLVSIVYTFVWLWLWDGTDDGVRFLLLLMATVVTIVSIALIIALTSSGWQRWIGVPFAGLVLVLLYAGVMLIGNRYTNYSITEERATHIQKAIDSYHAKTGWYPLSLNELTPRELWRIPLPMIIPDQGWCYEGGSNYYRLGLVYREHWSSPYLNVRVYASAGDFPKESWICDQKLTELRAKNQAKLNSPLTQTSLPDSSVSIPRTHVEPILSGNTFSVGSWSPDGSYLVFGKTEYFMGKGEDVKIDLYFLEAKSGGICQPPESQWTVQKSDGLREHYAWLPDGRFLYVANSGEMWAYLPCSGEVEDLSNMFSTKFTNAVSFHEQTGQVLLKDQDGLWLLNGSNLEARMIAGVPVDSYRAWCAWSQDGKHLAVSLLMGPEEENDAFLFIIDTETGEVENKIALQNVSDANLPIVEWLTRDELLLQGQSLTVMDFRSDPLKTTDLIHDIFLLDIGYPTDVSSIDTHTYPTGDGYVIGLRVNHPHNQGVYLYDSMSGQVKVFEHDTHSLFFFPDGGWMQLPKWEDTPSYTDEYEIMWMDQAGTQQRLKVEGHVPRSQPQLFPKYLPSSSRLVFNSSQGISLVSIPDGETIRFWELSGKTDFFSVFPSPNEEALFVKADGDGIYYIPLPPN